MQTTTFETAKVGDRVWSIEFGWGEILSLGESETYPVKVFWKNQAWESYTLEGKQLARHVCRTLFWDEVKIDAPHKPLPKLEVDAKVLVWTDPSMKQRRHFSHFSKDGRIWTFDAGATSFTKLHRNSTTAWLYWEPVE